MKEVTVKHGVGNQVTLQFQEQATVGQILSDARVKAALAYGENVEGAIHGVPQGSNIVVPGGSTLAVHNKACEKAN